MRQTLSVDSIARRRQATTTTTSHCCCVQRRVEIWVHRNIIVLATTAWVESLCQWGRAAVVVVHCSAVECDDCLGQRPTRDLHCPVISDEPTWRQWMFSVDNQWRLLHSPTDRHWLANNILCIKLIQSRTRWHPWKLAQHKQPLIYRPKPDRIFHAYATLHYCKVNDINKPTQTMIKC